MSESVSLLMAQINPTVGAIEANAEKIIDIIKTHQATHDLIVFPELALTGYPPEDLLLRPEFMARTNKALAEITAATENTHAVLGHPTQHGDLCYNALSILHQGKTIARYHKQHLPNTGVFDERRYFAPGTDTAPTLTLKQQTFGFCICEDLWKRGPVEQIIHAKADVLVCLNASPFDIDKPKQRLQLLNAHAPHHLTLVYVNLVGGQDELIFDGGSFVLNHQGEIKARAPVFVEHLQTVELAPQNIQSEIVAAPEQTALIYQALCSNLAEYVQKNRFSGVLLGLSGGIDSALTLAIAVDALGAENVQPLMLPSRYTADISLLDSEQLLKNLKLENHIVSIEPGFKALLESLESNVTLSDIAKQNLQARLRGMILMAFSNSNGKLVLSTSNKSESAVGYTTLYGDMCGGFAPIKDVPKMLVYELARYRNTLSPVIPLRILTRAPSAELALNQTDQDTLPDYPELDQIISYYMHEKMSTAEIIAKGHAEEEVYHIIRLIKQNEYKRRQAPLGTKITPRAFGRDWRYPITSIF